MNVQSCPSSSDSFERLWKHTERSLESVSHSKYGTKLDTVTVLAQIYAPSHQILLKFHCSEFLQTVRNFHFLPPQSLMYFWDSITSLSIILAFLASFSHILRTSSANFLISSRSFETWPIHRLSVSTKFLTSALPRCEDCFVVVWSSVPCPRP